MSSGRRLSASSDDSFGAGPNTPMLPATDSSTALILVHDDEENSLMQLEEEIDADEASDDEDFFLGRSQSEALSPIAVFAYLLGPYLKLGAMLLPNTLLPLKLGLPALLLFAVLSVFARQIWYMLARYLRKGDMEDVIVSVFAKEHRSRQWLRDMLRILVRVGTGSLRVLLATIYFRESLRTFVPFLSETLTTPYRDVLVTIVLALGIFPFCTPPSLAWRRVVWTSWCSIITYVVWFGLVAFAHGKGMLSVNRGWLRMGVLWEGITTTAFALGSSSTLPLYSCLKAGMIPMHSTKKNLAGSFRTLSLISAGIAVLLTFPLVMFAAQPNTPEAQDIPASDPSTRLEPFIHTMYALTLLFSIPSIIVTTPSLPISQRLQQRTRIPISKLLIFILVVVLAHMPGSVTSILSDVLLVCALASTYLLPAFVHITAHFVRRPLAIVIPSSAATPRYPPPQSSSLEDGPSLSSAADELLQRKERALQKKQLKKRIVWDIGVWVMLIPIGGGGIAWAAGRLARRW